MTNFDPYGEGGNATVRNFPDGTLRTLRNGGDPADATSWVIIGAAPSQARTATAPNIDYTPDGRAFYWDTSYGRSPVRQYVPDLDDPTKASGYVRPSAPRVPNYQITPDPSTGRLIAIDPANPTNRIDLGAFGFQEYSPQEKRAFDVTDRAEQRAYQQGETAADRAFRKGESAIDRAIRASEFAATFNSGEAARKADIEARNQQMAFAAEQDYQNRLAQFGQAQQQRARQFAELISATDPGALPAFLAAGGGNIGNALAAGATAQTDTANIGAAKTLRAQRETPAPTRFSVSPIAYSPATFTGITIPGPASAPAAVKPDATPGFTVNPNGGIDLSASEIQAGATYQGTPGFAMGTQMPGYADGTDAAEPNYFDMYVTLRSGGSSESQAVEFINTLMRHSQALQGNSAAMPAVQEQHAPMMPDAIIPPAPAASSPMANGGGQADIERLNREIPWQNPPGSITTLGGAYDQMDAVPNASQWEIERLNSGINWQSRPGQVTYGAAPVGAMPSAMPMPAPVQRMSNLSRFMPRFADGTTDFIPAPPVFRVGDSPTGMPTGREETVEVIDPEGNANVRVTPDNVQLPDEMGMGQPMADGMDDGGSGKFRLFGDVLKAVGSYLTDEAAPSMPRFALGTYTGTMADELVSPGDEPYLGEVRQIRNSVQFPDFNPYDTSFANQLPTMQQRFYAGRQTKYGVPVQDQAAEEQRYRVQGANRGAFQLGT